VFGKRNGTQNRYERRSEVIGTGRAPLRSRLSYANVTASLALFVALGGTAAAAVTLPRDSVGAPQIREDAVRSPEITQDAVRSSEIRDQSINFGDVSPGAASKLRGRLLFAEDDNEAVEPVPECDRIDLRNCPDFLVLELAPGGADQPARNWLVQAKADVHVDAPVPDVNNRCGLVNTEQRGPNAVLDQVHVHDLKESTDLVKQDQGIALSAVVKKRAGNPTIALRCTRLERISGLFDTVAPTFAKIVALEVGSVTGP
jgi:hypothetical protein